MKRLWLAAIVAVTACGAGEASHPHQTAFADTAELTQALGAPCAVEGSESLALWTYHVVAVSTDERYQQAACDAPGWKPWQFLIQAGIPRCSFSPWE